MAQVINVVEAVITGDRGDGPKIFATRRGPGKPMAGYWEFPVSHGQAHFVPPLTAKPTPSIWIFSACYSTYIFHPPRKDFTPVVYGVHYTWGQNY